MTKLCVHHILHAPKWPSYFCNIWALCVSQIYMVYIFICLFSVRNTINLSYHEHVHSGPMMGEISFETVLLNIPPSHSFLSTAKHLGKIIRLGYRVFTLFAYLIVLKSFMNKTKFNGFEKMLIFSYSLLSKMLKFRRSSLRLVFLIKVVYNQFLLLKNYRLWHWISSFIWFLTANLESIVFDLPASHETPYWTGVSWNFIKFGTKTGVWERGKQAIIEAWFSK